MRQEISDLKKQNSQLKEDLQNSARLVHNIYMFIETDKLTNQAAAIRGKILSLFQSLHKYLELYPTPEIITVLTAGWLSS